MLSFFSGNSIWILIKQSDWMTTSVLLFLFVMSIFCWSIFFYKILVWRLKKRQLKRINEELAKATDLEDVLALVSTFSYDLGSYFLSKNLKNLKSILSRKSENKALIESEWNLLRQMIDNNLDEIVYQQEANLAVLSVSAGLAPLLGLFGTIWGLVHSFIEISQKQSADITTVAPGIAEALITTLAGLMVAIPALAMYHYLKLQVTSLEQRLILLSDKFLFLAQSFFIKAE